MGYCTGVIEEDMEVCPGDSERFGDCSLGADEFLDIKKGDPCDHAAFKAFHKYNISQQSKNKSPPELEDPQEYRDSYKLACEKTSGCKWISGVVKAVSIAEQRVKNDVVSVVNKNPSSINCEMYSQTCGFKHKIETCEKNYEDTQSSLRSKSNKLNLSYGINFGLFLAIVILIVVLILNKKK